MHLNASLRLINGVFLLKNASQYGLKPSRFSVRRGEKQVFILLKTSSKKGLLWVENSLRFWKIVRKISFITLLFTSVKESIEELDKTTTMKTIILDTNFLINCTKFHIDLFSELERILTAPYKIAVLEQTLQELEKVNPKELCLIKKFLENIEVLKKEGMNVDDSLTALSHQGAIIATQDKALKKRLKKPLITIRQKKYLTLLD